jgi:phenylpropionate dioxygenase-like ring-hydroxylating dioxygenase large terminal subunit
LLSAEKNERLCRVGPGTAMGETFRRYWLPALLSEELPEPDGPPVRVRLLGEDLIAFRATDGSVGLVEAYCPHRRAPMFFGRNEENGLRCVYHGWKFATDGTCVDMPSEPPDSLFRTKVRIASYPTYETGGFVWTYMGPAERAPRPPNYEFLRAPATHRYPSKTFEDCNWLQALEGGLDSSHATILHNMQIGDLSWLQNFEETVPRLAVEHTSYGYTYSAVRRLSDHQWVRVYHYVMPSIQIRGTIQGVDLQDGYVPRVDGHLWVPIDDERTWVYNFMYSHDPATPLPQEQAIGVETRAGRGPNDLSAGYRPKRNRENDYLIDRELQKRRSFTGIVGVNTQDFALQEGMGPIVDRTKEHLGTTDRAVIVARRLLLEATDAVAEGRMPKGCDPADSQDLRPLDHRIPLESDWRVALRDELVARY